MLNQKHGRSFHHNKLKETYLYLISTDSKRILLFKLSLINFHDLINDISKGKIKIKNENIGDLIDHQNYKKF